MPIKIVMFAQYHTAFSHRKTSSFSQNWFLRFLFLIKKRVCLKYGAHKSTDVSWFSKFPALKSSISGGSIPHVQINHKKWCFFYPHSIATYHLVYAHYDSMFPGELMFDVFEPPFVSCPKKNAQELPYGQNDPHSDTPSWQSFWHIPWKYIWHI